MSMAGSVVVFVCLCLCYCPSLLLHLCLCIRVCVVIRAPTCTRVLAMLECECGWVVYTKDFTVQDEGVIFWGCMCVCARMRTCLRV